MLGPYVHMGGNSKMLGKNLALGVHYCEQIRLLMH